jgi:hypothetical protein
MKSFPMQEMHLLRKSKLRLAHGEKIDLLVSINPAWEDLFPRLISGEVEELRRIKKHFK